SLTGATSNSFTINPAADDHLSFDVQPSDTKIGRASCRESEVGIEDQYGNMTHCTSNVTVSIDGATPPTLYGTATQAAVNGSGTFRHPTLPRAGSYDVGSASLSLTGATSNSFTINPAADDHLSFDVQPSDT